MTLYKTVISKKGNKYIARQNQQFTPLGVKIPMPNAPDITMEPGVIQTKGGTVGLMPRNIEYPADKYSIDEILGHISYLNSISDSCPGCKEIRETIKKEGIAKKPHEESSASSSRTQTLSGKKNHTNLRIPPLLRRKSLREIIFSRYSD